MGLLNGFNLSCALCFVRFRRVVTQLLVLAGPDKEVRFSRLQSCLDTTPGANLSKPASLHRGEPMKGWLP